jgi:hypothetical protein
MTNATLSEYGNELARIKSRIVKAGQSKKRKSDLYAEARQITTQQLRREIRFAPFKRAAKWLKGGK